MGKFNAVPTIDFDQTDAPDIEPLSPVTTMPSEPKVQYNNDYNPFRKTPVMHNWQTLYDDFSHSTDRPEALPSRMNGDPVPGSIDDFIPSSIGNPVSGTEGESLPSRMSTVLDDVPDYVEPLTVPVEPLQQTPSVEAHKSTFRKYLQVSGRYIVASTKRGMVVIDQHRAHMTVLFDRYYHQIGNRQGISQNELFPEMIDIAPADVPVFESILPTLKYLGFEIDSLGGGSYAVNGKPASLEKSLDLHALLMQMIEATKEETHAAREQIDRILALQLSKAQAMQAGKLLSEEEMSQLVDALYDIPDHTYAPDGRPIAIQLTNEELAERF